MKTRQIIYKTLVLALPLVALSSCDDYLDTMPDNRTTLDTEEKVANLLVTAYPDAGSMLINELMSDNVDYFGMRNPYGNKFGDQVYAWKDVTEKKNEAPLQLWQVDYSAIAEANQALQTIEDMGGATTPSLKASKAEALLCRAYAHFLLVNEFCSHYNENTSNKDLGIYYSKKVEKINDKHERGTVAQVYQQIEKDIQEALPLVTDNYKVPKYHFNKKAAYAFATRFYLYYAKWDKALQYANLCLGEHPEESLRDWKVMGEMPNNYFAITQHYVEANNPANIMLSTYTSVASMAFIPVPIMYKRYSHGKYISYNEDVFAKNVWGDDAKYYLKPAVGAAANAEATCMYKIPYLFETVDPVSKIGIPKTVIAVFTTDETLLARAEAYIMLKQYDKAAADLNLWMHNIVKTDVQLTPQLIQKFYNSVGYCYDDETKLNSTIKKHLHPAFPIGKEGSVQETMLQCVLGFRRIETLHEGLRWFDVKRYGIEIKRRLLDVKGNPEKELDILKVNDPRRAVQIPYDIVQAGVQPNPRHVNK